MTLEIDENNPEDTLINHCALVQPRYPSVLPTLHAWCDHRHGSVWPNPADFHRYSTAIIRPADCFED